VTTPVVTLVWHRISPYPLPAGTWVSPGQLARQLDRLAHAGAEFWDPADAADTSRSRGLPVVVTFDDATIDLYTYRGILDERGIRPLVFVPVDLVGRPNCWEWPVPGRRTSHLDVEQLRELAANHWRIGLHGASHRDLTRLQDAELTAEVTRARHSLVSMIGGEVDSFSYPFGRCDQRVVREVVRAGFKRAYGMTRRQPEVPAQYQLPRRPVYCIDTPGDLVSKVKDPQGLTAAGRWQLRKERWAHGVGHWTANWR